MTAESHGFLYLVFGDQAFLRESLSSVRSLRRHHRDPHVTLVTDLRGSEVPAAADDAFDRIVRPTRREAGTREDGHLFKVRHMYEASPYERTFFVDTDTRFLADCSDLFELLKHFDLCLAQAPSDAFTPLDADRDLRACKPYNSGVILFRENDRVEELFRLWRRRYEADLERYPRDQPALTQALLECERRVDSYVLQSTANFRTPYNERLLGPVRIMHGRPEAPERVAEEVNRTHENRAWLAEPEVTVPRRLTLREQLRLMRKLGMHFLRMCRHRIRELLSPRRSG